MAVSSLREVPLAAYTNRLSARPKDTVTFHVSTTTNSNITAKLSRCICADPNPKGPGYIEEDASNYFKTQQFFGRRQKINNGSFAKSKNVIDIPTKIYSLSVEIWMWPTYIPKIDNTTNDTKEVEDGSSIQCVWSWGELAMYLLPNGHLSVSFNNGEDSMRARTPLTINKWYHVTVTLTDNSISNTKYNYKLNIKQQQDNTSKETCVERSLKIKNKCIPKDSHFELATNGTFNGRLEHPQIKVVVDESTHGVKTYLISWDTSINMTEWSIPSIIDGSSSI